MVQGSEEKVGSDRAGLLCSTVMAYSAYRNISILPKQLLAVETDLSSHNEAKNGENRRPAVSTLLYSHR